MKEKLFGKGINMFKYLSQLLLIIIVLTMAECKDNPVDSNKFSAAAGPILFISDKSGTSQLYSMNEDGSNIQQLTNDPNFPIVYASWSPDGSKIALQSTVGGVPSFGHALYICNSDGTNRYLLTKPTAWSSDSLYYYRGIKEAFWSPDSKEIAFIRIYEAEPIPSDDIFIIDVEGKNEMRFTNTPRIQKEISSWSPDGNYIAVRVIDFYHPDTVANLLISRRVIFNMQGIEVKSWVGGGYIHYSTKGDKIAYESVGAMVIINLDGTVLNTVQYQSFLSWYIISWSPDDTKLLCTGTTDGYTTNETYLLDLQTGKVTDITPFKDYTGLQSACCWKRR